MDKVRLRLLLSWYQELGVTEILKPNLCPAGAAEGSAAPTFSPVAAPSSSAPQEPGVSPSLPQSPAPASPVSLGSRNVSAGHALLSGIKTLEELKAYMEGFEGCALKDTAINMVFSDGNPKARVMLVGEAPGAEEDRQGLPFVGLSGKLLDRMLAAINLDRKSVYISNIVPWRPPGNRVPSTEEISLCLPLIEKHISLVSPDLLVLVGGTAIKALLRTNQGVTRLRGTWHTWEDPFSQRVFPALATFHPAYLLRSPGQKKEAWKDLLMLKDRIDRENKDGRFKQAAEENL